DAGERRAEHRRLRRRVRLPDLVPVQRGADAGAAAHAHHRAGAEAYQMGDRTARPPYDYENLRVSVNDMPPVLRASWLRGVAALPNSFAHESYIDELAAAAGADPVEFRLRYLKDARAAELLRSTA